AAGATAFAGLAEQGELVDQNLRAVLLLAGFLIVPGARLNLALDVELGALLYIVADDLGGAVEGDEVVPFGLVLPVALLIFLPVSRGEREAGDSRAARGGTDLGVFADVAEEKNFVDAFCHEDAPKWCVV